MTQAQDYGYELSPTSSPDLNDGNNLYDDDIPENGEVGAKPRKAGSRRGPGAADKRATHNAIERARRESLNGRFMTLARALPSMANVKRPSKSIIVNKALDFVYEAQVKEHALVSENNDLRREVDHLRARLGMSPLSPPAPLPIASSRAQSNASTTFSTYSLHSQLDGRSASLHSGGHSPSSQSPERENQLINGSETYGATLPSPSPTDENSCLAFPLYQANNNSTDESQSASGGRTPESLVLEDTNSKPVPLDALSPASFLSFNQSGVTLGGMNAAAQGQAMLQHGFGYIQNPALIAAQQQFVQSMQNHNPYQLQQQQQQQQNIYGVNTQGAVAVGGGAPGGDWGSFNSYASWA